MGVPLSDAFAYDSLSSRPVNPGVDKIGMRWVDRDTNNESLWTQDGWVIPVSPQLAGQLILVTSSNQSIPDNTWTDIIWGSASNNYPSNLWSSGTPAEINGPDASLSDSAYSGIYLMTCQVEFAASALCVYEMEIYDPNGGGTPITFGRDVRNQVSNTVNTVLSCSVITPFPNTSSKRRVRVRQNSGGALDIIHASGADQMTRLQIVQIGQE